MHKTGFAKSFMEGFVSIVDVFSSPPENPIAGKSTEELIREDWVSVGRSISESTREVGCEIRKLHERNG